jgi:5-methyltetrahydrofolate--homocysteine methyltransferase
MSRFLEVLHSGRAVLMDGAMGTELERAGARTGECYEHWNLTEPEKVRGVHQAYVDAGAEILLTNTFQANPTALARHDLQDRLEDINRKAIALARSVGRGQPLVVASIGPIEGAHAPDDVPNADALDRTVRSLLGADALLLETWSGPLALWAVQYGCRCARELADLPVLLSLTYRYQRSPTRSLWTLSGHPPEWFAAQAKHNGVAALGVNCGRDMGMSEVIEIVRRYRQVTDLPLFARPNAGTPRRDGERWVYPQTPETMAAHLPELLEAGVSMVGGCCGTTPAHIAAFRPIVDRWNAALAK